jgi:hypothetical protein
MGKPFQPQKRRRRCQEVGPMCGRSLHGLHPIVSFIHSSVMFVTYAQVFISGFGFPAQSDTDLADTLILIDLRFPEWIRQTLTPPASSRPPGDTCTEGKLLLEVKRHFGLPFAQKCTLAGSCNKRTANWWNSLPFASQNRFTSLDPVPHGKRLRAVRGWVKFRK